jgi:hypothetical protein
VSKYTSVRTMFRDKESLVEALRTIYPATQVHEQAVHLFGYAGDKRAQTAEIVIPRSTKGGLGSASNDLGFKLQPDGSYEAIISDFDQGQVGKGFIDKLSRDYTKRVTMRQALIQGLRFVQETTNEAGEVQLEFAVL